MTSFMPESMLLIIICFIFLMEILMMFVFHDGEEAFMFSDRWAENMLVEIT